MRTLRQSLLDRDLAFLEVIAQRWALVLESHRKAEVIDQLESALLEPEAVAATLADLQPEEREALDALLAAGGRMSAETFGRRYGSIRAVGPGRLRREEPWREPANSTESLWYRGLIAFAFDLKAPEAKVVYIASDLARLLPDPGHEHPHFVVTSAPPPERPEVGASAFRQDMCTFLTYVYAEAVRTGPKGTLPHRHRRRLVGALLGKDRDRLSLIEHLARRLGLVTERDHHLRLLLSPTRGWLRASPGQQLRSLQQSWSGSAEWNELWRVPSLRCQPTGWKNDPLATRRRLLDWLARCPNGEWLSIESFIRAVRSADPEFQRLDGDYDAWYIRDATTGAYLTGFESWDRVEGALISDLLARSLFWLGVVALGTHGEGPTAFRITSHGETFLTDQTPAESDPAPPLRLTPDLMIQAPIEGNLFDRFQLARFAEWVASRAAEEAYPLSYRITPESLARSGAEGITLSQILAFLERATQGNVPRNVPVRLADWERKAGKITLRRAVLLQTTDDLTMQELQRLPQTRQYLGEVLGPRAALVAEDDWARLVQELRTLGYLPEVGPLRRSHSPLN
jgi:hypothetical protein